MTTVGLQAQKQAEVTFTPSPSTPLNCKMWSSEVHCAIREGSCYYLETYLRQRSYLLLSWLHLETSGTLTAIFVCPFYFVTNVNNKELFSKVVYGLVDAHTMSLTFMVKLDDQFCDMGFLRQNNRKLYLGWKISRILQPSI